MKKKIAFIIILCSVFFIIKLGISNEYIPPYNQMLFKLYPDIKVKFPQVPRISAQDALRMYIRGNAFFLGLGHQNSAVPGGLYVEPGRSYGSEINVERLKAAFLPNNKLLIVY